MIVGWTGYVPSTCRRTIAGTYVDTGPLLWGWPARFAGRMKRAGTVVILHRGGQAEPEFAAAIPAGYTGGVLTDRIETIRDWMAD